MGFNAKKQVEQRTTYEGGKAYQEQHVLELYRLMASSLMTGDTFYAPGGERLARFRALVDNVLKMNGGEQVIVAMAVWGREKLYLRTMPTLLVTELLVRGRYAGLHAADRIWVRGDEHLEALAYLGVVGAKRTKRLLKAVANAIGRLNEYKAVKYQHSSRNYSQRDALKLSHPVPTTPEQNELFKWILHGTDEFGVYRKSSEGKGAPAKWVQTYTSRVNLELLPFIAGKGKEAAWEQIISDEGASKESWEKAVPVMGYTALMRNLRNLVEHGVSDGILRTVAAGLADPEKAKQLPYRYYSALKHLPSNAPSYLRNALATAMDVSADNLPRLDGETLLLVDISGSMDDRLSDKSDVSRIEAVAPLAGALARQGGVTTWIFGAEARIVNIPAKTPVLASMQMIMNYGGIRRSTATERALKTATKDRAFDRIIILTDGQAEDNPGRFLLQYVQANEGCSVYHVDVAGYAPHSIPSHPRIHVAAGFSDHVLDWIGAVSDMNPIKKMLDYAGL